jgi:hypothetical protein
VFDHTHHKELWNWLAENPYDEKCDWPGWYYNGGKVDYAESDCFACESSCNDCEECPLIWPKNINCFDMHGLYQRWLLSDDTEERKKLAEQIRDLPVREWVEVI